MSGFIFKQLQIIKYEMESELFWEISVNREKVSLCACWQERINSSWRRLWWEAAPRPLMSSSAQAAGRTMKNRRTCQRAQCRRVSRDRWLLQRPHSIFNDMQWVPTWSSCLFFKWNFWGKSIAKMATEFYMNHNEAPTTALLQCFRLLTTNFEW